MKFESAPIPIPMYQFRQNVNGDMIYLISIGSLTSRTWIGFHSPFRSSFSYLRSCRSIVASIVRACRLSLPLRRHRPRPFPRGQQALALGRRTDSASGCHGPRSSRRGDRAMILDWGPAGPEPAIIPRFFTPPHRSI